MLDSCFLFTIPKACAAYAKVDTVSSTAKMEGDTVAMMHVFDLPPSAS
jgi:hypothetical protein